MKIKSDEGNYRLWINYQLTFIIPNIIKFILKYINNKYCKKV